MIKKKKNNQIGCMFEVLILYLFNFNVFVNPDGKSVPQQQPVERYVHFEVTFLTVLPSQSPISPASSFTPPCSSVVG